MSANATSPISTEGRRPLKSRQTRWAAVSAAWLARNNVSPNAISLGSILFAAVAGAAYLVCVYVHNPVVVSAMLLVACLGIQGRLLCNLLDGMVAVEGGKGSRAGEIYNDAPDRVADAIIFATCGYATLLPYGPLVGWLAVVMALMTAYVRVLGRSIGAGVYFIGPMAKQHRMALLTVANLAGACLTFWGWHRWALLGALSLIVIGGVVTCLRRLKVIARDLGAKA